MARLTLVVPCYNEEERLPTEEFRAFKLPSHDLRVLFVNDGSQDRTSDVLRGLASEEPERFSALDLDANRGKAEAVRQGILAALSGPADLVGFWDADLATPLPELDRFARVFETHPDVDAVLGSRVQLLGRHIDRKVYRHVYGRTFAAAVSTVLSLPIYDSQCGAKVFRANDALRTVFTDPFLSRWVFDVEILARYISVYHARGQDPRAHLYELPLKSWTHIEGSKIGPKDAAIAFMDLARIAARYRLMRSDQTPG